MRICLIGPTYPFRGGISHYTTLLYRHIKKHHDACFFGFKRQYPRWLFPGRTDKDNSNNPIREDGVENILDSLNPVTWLKVFVRIKQFSPELVILPWWVSFWAPQFWTITTLLKRFTRVKILFVCHNVVEHESTWIDRKASELVLRNGDLFIVHSNEDRRNLLIMFPEAKLKRTVLPTDDSFDFESSDPEVIRKKYGIRGNLLLFFGFVREYKGLKYLLKALPEVLSFTDVTLLVVGEFWDRKSEYLKLIEELNIAHNVIIVDKYVPNEDIGLYFSAADIVIQPYVSATGSAVIQLAYGFNKPVIATNVGSLSEVVEDGKTGFIVPPKSSQRLAAATVKFLQEKHILNFSKNITRARRKFSWDRMLNDIENLVGQEYTSY